MRERPPAPSPASRARWGCAGMDEGCRNSLGFRTLTFGGCPALPQAFNQPTRLMCTLGAGLRGLGDRQLREGGFPAGGAVRARGSYGPPRGLWASGVGEGRGCTRTLIPARRSPPLTPPTPAAFPCSPSGAASGMLHIPAADGRLRRKTSGRPFIPTSFRN